LTLRHLTLDTSLDTTLDTSFLTLNITLRRTFRGSDRNSSSRQPFFTEGGCERAKRSEAKRIQTNPINPLTTVLQPENHLPPRHGLLPETSQSPARVDAQHDRCGWEAGRDTSRRNGGAERRQGVFLPVSERPQSAASTGAVRILYDTGLSKGTRQDNTSRRESR
jgi:hypothetical protein